MTIAIVALSAVVVAAHPASAASTINVTTQLDASGGSACSLRDAIASADTNTDVGGCVGSGGGSPFVIMLPAGTYDLTLGELATGTSSGASISIEGAGSASTIIDQQTASSRVFDLDPSVVGDVAISLSGMTIEGGMAQTFGGGAILGGGTGDSLTLTDSVVTGNGCSGSFSAAGISWSPAGDVTITNTTFSNNTCGGAGGAILYTTDGGTLTVTGSTFTGNTAGAPGSAGGALFLGPDGATPPTFQIDHTTFTHNQATDASGIGGAIYTGGGSLALSDDRLVGNVAPFGGGVGVRGGTAIATNDWWGCNGGPDATGCDTTSSAGGTLTATPWITLTNTPIPSTIVPGQASTLTASVLTNSDGTTLTTSDISTLVGLPVAWGASHGALSGPQTSIQPDGTATATVTQDGTCADESASATVDNATALAAVSVLCPDLTATKTNDVSGSAVVGQPWTWTIDVANGGDASADFSTGQIVLSDNLPIGLSYGAPSSSDPNVGCTITADDLVCVASVDTTVAAGGSFTVQVPSSAGATGTFVNPRIGGSCSVDPNNVVIEQSESNNACADAVSVAKADTTTTITSNVPDPSVVGQSVVVTFGVTANAPGSGTPTGDVTVSDGSDSCTGTVAAGQCTLTFSTAGADSVTATYLGDGAFNGSTSAPATPQQVDRADTTTTITSDPVNPSVVGEPVTISYGVAVDSPGSGTPTGAVTVSDGTTSCTGSVADGQCTLTFTTAGTRSLTATYSGDGNFNGSVSPADSHEVDPAQTATSILFEGPDPSSIGEPVVVTYSVTAIAPGAGSPTGDVLVTDGTDSCTGSVATGQCIVGFGTAGTKSLTATYLGDGNFASSTSPLVLHVVNPSMTTTEITNSTPNPSVVGQTVTVQFQVTPDLAGPAPTGMVTVSGGGASCSASVADGQCSLAPTAAGTAVLSAAYSGDANNLPSTSAPFSQQVDPGPTSTVITSALPNPSIQGAPVVVQFTVIPVAPSAGTPTGIVTVSDGVDACSGSVASGQCTIILSTVGSRTLTASYLGDANFDGSTSPGVAHTVVPPNTPPTATVTGGTCAPKNRASGTVQFTVGDPDGDPVTLVLTSNSNPTLVPQSGITLTGTGAIRTLAVAAASKMSGTATLTFTLDDGGHFTVPVVVTVIVGTQKSETLNGTDGTDLIFGLGGNDVINGLGGNDVLCGGNGNDTLNGGDGNDFLYGGNGNDVLNGGNGNDAMYGGRGDDTLTGGPGADFFSGGPGFDVATDFNPSQGDTTDGTIP